MTRTEAEQIVLQNREQNITEKAQRPEGTAWRTELPEQCMTEHFMQFAKAVRSGLELKNIFSIYSKLEIACPEFVDDYICLGPTVKHPMSGEWNLKERVFRDYNINEAAWRIIEQEKTTDKYGTTRSGFETLQAIFIKDLVLGQKGDHGDYKVNGIAIENKGESGRMIGQEPLFDGNELIHAIENLCYSFGQKTFDKALRKAELVDQLDPYLHRMLKGIYNGLAWNDYMELIGIYKEIIKEIPISREITDWKPVCTKRASKKTGPAQYDVKEYIRTVETCTGVREKEVFRYVAGLMELYVYRKRAGFGILDLCEASTGRILTFDLRGTSLRNIDEQLRGKVRFYSGIGSGTRDGAHQIGFVY